MNNKKGINKKDEGSPAIKINLSHNPNFGLFLFAFAYTISKGPDSSVSK
jgi:hypothetical protein